MREILFRGKRKDNGKWIYGNLVKTKENIYIIKENSSIYGIGFIEVIPETIGQYTGLKDVNGNKVFEGDILIKDRRTLFKPDAEPCITKIYYDSNNAKFWIKGTNIDLKFFYFSDLKNFKLIGNIYDNPELLEEIEN